MLAWAKSSAAAVMHRVRFASRIVPELEVVYIGEDHNAALARRLWADLVAAASITITSTEAATEVAATGCDRGTRGTPRTAGDAQAMILRLGISSISKIYRQAHVRYPFRVRPTADYRLANRQMRRQLCVAIGCAGCCDESHPAGTNR